MTPLTIQRKNSRFYMYCDKQEFMTSMSIKVEKVANPFNLKFHFELDELLDLTWMLQIISSEIKLESTNNETCRG